MTEPQGRYVQIMGRSLVTPGMLIEQLAEAETGIGKLLNEKDLSPERRKLLEDTLQEIHRQMEVAAHKDPRPVIKDIPL